MTIDTSPRSDVELLRVLADGDWHSGARVAERLGISRSAVWKRLQVLEGRGLQVESQPGRGYRLVSALSLLDAARIHAAIPPPERGLVADVQVLARAGSTNSELLARLPAQGVACIAEEQSGGRGRRGRMWHSPVAENLYLSWAHREDTGAGALVGLSLAAGVAMAEWLARQGVPVQVKWPNDLLVGDAKLGGILVEMQGDAAGPCWVVIGVGLNVNMQRAPDLGQRWTSLRQELGAMQDRSRLAGELVGLLARLCEDFARQGFAAWHERYQRRDALRGRPVLLVDGEQRHEGTACGVDASGALEVETARGRRRYLSGEVSVRAADSGAG